MHSLLSNTQECAILRTLEDLKQLTIGAVDGSIGKVKDSPDIDTDKPVSRQHEMVFLNYYGLPYYWGGPMLWGPTAYPTALKSATETEPLRPGHSVEDESSRDGSDPHLR